MTPNHEAAFVRAFVRKSKQARWMELLGKEGTRKKIIDELYHCGDLIQAQQIAGAQQHRDAILELLRKNGAPGECHIISTNARLDGKQMPLAEALDSIRAGSHQVPSIVSCVPGKLALYEGEDMSASYLLLKG